MGLGTLFALTIPGLAVLLVVLAVVERIASGRRRASPLHRERRPGTDGAPPRSRIDLDAGVAHLVLPPPR